MLSLYQRLVLGCLLLVALVTGVSMLVRTSFVQLGSIDASLDTADHALASLAAVRASLAIEELTTARLESDASATISDELMAQSHSTQAELDTAASSVAAFDASIPIPALQTEHARILANIRENFGRLAAQLEALNEKVGTSFNTLQ